MFQVEGERATWHLVQLTGRRGEAAGAEKRRRRKEKGDDEEEVGDIASTDSVTRWFRIFCNTSGFWPRVRARALRAPVFLGSLTRQKGRCAPPPVRRSFAASYSSKIKITYFPKQNAYLQTQTRAARDVDLSTGLSCTLLSYIAPS